MAERASPLAGRHAVVTGGGRGIGRAIAARLAGAGASVTLMGRDEAKLGQAARALGDACDWHAADVGDAAAVERAFASVVERHRDFAILVNNAGVAHSARFAATDDALWDEMLRVNLTGVYRCTRAALPAISAAGSGRIVNVASTAGLVGYPYVSAYCAAKHGVVGFTRALAIELATTGVTINAVCPGYTDTELVDRAVAKIVAKTGRTSADARSELAARNPQKRLVTADEVASAVLWLCLPESQSINGQAIAVAGGEVTVG
jgi:NAD(P)-dependent dehydrogenase (short-subunit alcohol dehydrogenase family)